MSWRTGQSEAVERFGSENSDSTATRTPDTALFTALTAFAFVICAAPFHSHAQTKPRARELGIPFDGTPGPLNRITDVAGVSVGYTVDGM